MNGKELRTIVMTFLVLLPMQAVWGKSARSSVRQGNNLYSEGEYNKAIEKYDEALSEKPGALEPKFNKANSFYRLDDLAKAIELYREAAAESKDMKLVARSKYNLGNSHFQQGLKQRDSDLRKAIEELKTGIGCWRDVLELEPENEQAARNIEVARLIIKDIIDQLNKQRQQQEQSDQQEQHQDKQEQTKSQNGDQEQRDQQQQRGLQEDPNQPQEPNRPQEQRQQEPKAAAVETSAQEILDKEQREKKERQRLQRARYQRVEKDW